MIPGRLPESFKVLSGSDENFNPGSWVEGYLPDPTNTIRGKRFYQGPSAKTPEEAMRKAAMDKEFASKGRLIENVQSDWHQAGAKEGYQSPTGPQGLEPTQQALTEAYKHMSDSEDRVLELERQYPNAYLEDDTFPEELQKALDDAARARMNHENIRARFNELARMDPQVPDAPFKQSWPDLALKRQVLDVANSPDLEWLGITPGEELVGRGEGQSPVFHNEILPNKLMKILKPFGGKVEKIGEVPRSKVPDIDYAGLGHIRSTNTDYIPGDETHIADLWPPYKYDYEKGPANMQGERASEQRRGYELADLVRNSQRNTRPFKGAHFSPDLKALIKKNGLSYMSLLGLIGAGKALDNQDDSEVR